MTPSRWKNILLGGSDLCICPLLCGLLILFQQQLHGFGGVSSHKVKRLSHQSSRDRARLRARPTVQKAREAHQPNHPGRIFRYPQRSTDNFVTGYQWHKIIQELGQYPAGGVHGQALAPAYAPPFISAVFPSHTLSHAVRFSLTVKQPSAAYEKNNKKNGQRENSAFFFALPYLQTQ